MPCWHAEVREIRGLVDSLGHAAFVSTVMHEDGHSWRHLVADLIESRRLATMPAIRKKICQLQVLSIIVCIHMGGEGSTVHVPITGHTCTPIQQGSRMLPHWFNMLSDLQGPCW